MIIRLTALCDTMIFVEIGNDNHFNYGSFSHLHAVSWKPSYGQILINFDCYRNSFECHFVALCCKWNSWLKLWSILANKMSKSIIIRHFEVRFNSRKFCIVTWLTNWCIYTETNTTTYKKETVCIAQHNSLTRSFHFSDQITWQC